MIDLPKNGQNLTGREREILRLIADGKSTKEIAQHLGVSFKTVCSHRCHILAKFGVHKSVEAARVAIRNGLIDP
jgi:DNA-binding NarL/FixJ family response regulator